MRYRIIVVAALVALAAFAATTKAKAAPLPPVSSWIQQCQTEGGRSYITDGVWEEESDCEADDSVLADPGEFGFTVEPVCIQGTTYLYADDDPPGDFLAFLKGLGYSAGAGTCSPGADAPKPVGIFLCYSTYQTDPGVWLKDDAEMLLKQGYWLPYAVPDNVAGGTNIGGFHLTCNLAASQSVSDEFVGQDGTVFGSAYAGVSGLYPKVG